jgi:hypothetical protein
MFDISISQLYMSLMERKQGEKIHKARKGISVPSKRSLGVVDSAKARNWCAYKQ